MLNSAKFPNRTISDKYRPRYSDDLETLASALEHSLSGTSETVESYEMALARYFFAKEAIAVSSGAAALSVALGALGVKAGDEVLLTPTCPLCTVYPVLAAGAVPIFVDTQKNHFTAELKSLDRALSKRTRAIIDIPMWGYPTPVDHLQSFARNCSIPLILDLAHAHGTQLHGKSLSAYADLACFSTHERKPLATGEGGFILTDDQTLAQRCRLYSRFGNLNGRDFGLNYKLGALPAALGQSRLKHLDSQLGIRRHNAERLMEQLAHPQIHELPIIDGGEPNYYFLNLKLAFEDNQRFIDYLDQHGIPSDIKRYGCRCLYEFPALAAYRRECLNGAELLASITTIPVHPGLSDADMDYIAHVINLYQEA
ncbi:DegT/DnrJ/EryC1/StrS family aminotransferase [Chitinivorax sp. B]|uniref:DegT/DnrJ/EryC1/StrS family aminotransferase n=1 Tax=Chitinivorax sp. B TaxID=2502235 RepID=UPI0010F8D0F1|nr:DegT/DnrJ/EryC1/StrS family aminotransferase [Chitinivorax sp. B]